MTVVLADIGGTHARFGTLAQGKIGRIEKMPVADFPDLQSALAAYSPGGGRLYMATAAWPHPDGTWRFARDGRWIIAPDDLKRAGWSSLYIGNDFGASARGAAVLPAEQLVCLQPCGRNDIPQRRVAVLGAGTGLGLAYVEGADVLETYGGMMDAPARTREQFEIVQLVAGLKDNERPVSAEDIISGPGLVLLYNAARMAAGLAPAAAAPEDMMTLPDDAHAATALRLFHEFLGLFAQQACLFGHAYKALFLDGGVIHRLNEAGLFDVRRFLEFFTGDPLPLIRRQLAAMPVHIVTDPYVALRGLQEIAADAT